MGNLNFTLPSGLSAEDAAALAHASIVGGPGSAPGRTEATVDADLLSLSRDWDESGHAAIPWRVRGTGRLMFSLATLRSRSEPYDLLIEIARGKVNQLRNQAAEWQANGLVVSPKLLRLIEDATRHFTKALARFDSDRASNSLALAADAGRQLAAAYAEHMLKGRRQFQADRPPALACRLNRSLIESKQTTQYEQTFTGASISFSLRETVPAEDQFNLDDCDDMVEWGVANRLSLMGGPFIHFENGEMPAWLQSRSRDRVGLAKIIGQYAGEIVKRYGDSISIWQLSTGANLPGAFPLQEDEVLWITLQLADAIHRIDPHAHLVIGVSQPWGECLAEEHRLYSPFSFADMLLRSGMPIAAINLEVVMGVSPSGSYCRDLLDFSRLLDLYSLLGVPLFVTLGYPAEAKEDVNAESDLSLSAGYWRENFNRQSQADWASAYASMALAKPQVRAVHWIHYSDAEKHYYPNCGLLDGQGKTRPALRRLRKLRQRHLS